MQKLSEGSVDGRITFHFFGTISFRWKSLDEPAKRIGAIYELSGSAIKLFQSANGRVIFVIDWPGKSETSPFLTRFFSHGELRWRKSRHRFCQKTFRESDENGHLQELGEWQPLPVAATKSYLAECAVFAGVAS